MSANTFNIMIARLKKKDGCYTLECPHCGSRDLQKLDSTSNKIPNINSEMVAYQEVLFECKVCNERVIARLDWNL